MTLSVTTLAAPIRAEAITAHPPSFDLEPDAHVVASDAEAIAVAEDARRGLRRERRDAGPRPHPSGRRARPFLGERAVGDHRAEGLWRRGRVLRDARRGHQDHLGGRPLARPDSPKPSRRRWMPSASRRAEEQKRLWFGRVLQGYRLGNAFSEAKSKHVGAFETTVTARGDASG